MFHKSNYGKYADEFKNDFDGYVFLEIEDAMSYGNFNHLSFVNDDEKREYLQVMVQHNKDTFENFERTPNLFMLQ